MDRTEQLRRWLAGDSQHDDRNECVPDYSCCHPELATSHEARQAYMEAHNREDHVALNHLTYAFLARKLSLHVTEDVYDHTISP